MAGVLIPAALSLAACGQVALAPANNPVSLSQQARSTQAVEARDVAANLPSQAPAAPATTAPAPSAAASGGHDMAPMGATPPASAASQAQQVYDPMLAPASTETVHQITLAAREGEQEIAPGVKYAVWTFEGRAPGPMLHVKQGDTVEFTLKNEGKMPHSMDFHAAQTPWNLNYRSINPGETLSFSFRANYPGVFMYHCGTAPALMHIADGMYGAIVVDPATPLAPAREFALVQSEFYTKPSATKGLLEGYYLKMQNGRPDYVVFNGTANQYVDHPLQVNPGELVRLWVVNAGPNDTSAFHVVGAILNKVYPDGNPANALSGMQTYNVPPGGGVMVELTVPDEGLYPIVTHSFADASKGALALLRAGNPPAAAGGH